MRQYSRLARVEEKKNIRSAIIFGGLTILFILFLIFFGLSIVARFASFVSDSKRGKIVTNLEGAPISAPNIITPLEFTNQSGIVIKGSAEPNSDVKVYINESPKDTTADSNGNFIANINLQKGENKIYATATNEDNVTSEKSKSFTIVFDNDAPKLDITSPTDTANFYGDTQKKITVQGSTDSEAELTINGHVVIINDDGSFKYDLTLNNGSNPINIASIDKAGNKKESVITVNYSP